MLLSTFEQASADLQSAFSDGLAPLAALMVFGLMTAAVRTRWTWYQSLFRHFVLFCFRLLYRVRIEGLGNIPSTGGAVLVANHSSWIDGPLLLMICPRRTRTLAWSGNFGNAAMRWLARFSEVILISGGPKSIVRSLKQAQQALLDGQLVGIFPEGGISRTGQIQSFRPGITRILDGTDVPIIPVYIDQLWGSIFTYSGGKAIWKLPRTFRRPITIHIGKPANAAGTAAPTTAKSLFDIRQSIQKLGADAVSLRQPPFVAPPQSFIRSCKKQKFRFKAADSTGATGRGGSVLMRSLILRRLLRRHVLDANESHVGVLIPPSFGGMAVNMALGLDGRVAVNLNYTVSNAIMNSCIRQAGIRHVLTSRKVMEKFDFTLECDVVYLDDLRNNVSLGDKLSGLIGAYVTPAGFLERSLGLHRIDPNDVLTIIFTSGSTGDPKGVMLTHRNIASNMAAIDQVIRLRPSDVLLGVLPFFHSFGYTVTLWGGMGLRIGAAYHFSPLDSMQIGKLCQQYNVSIILSTPTFLRSWMRKCQPEHFHALDVAVAGAEKLPSELCDAFEAKFGVRPIEGYGATELSPLVAVNIPPSRRGDNYMVDCKEGTVGRPVPNVAARITHVDSGEVLGVNEEGTLWITGPNVMKGYLNQPEKTAEVVVDGWYNTGDVALIDEDGFIKITGRISRFSKIGGEMVPHVTVEEALAAQLGPDEQEELKFAVTAVPDARKGERLIVLHTQLSKTPQCYCDGLVQAGLPNLYIPSANSFFLVESLPVLGTGKLDLRGLKMMAEQLVQ